MSAEHTHHRAQVALVISIAATVAVYTLPYGRILGHPLILLSTLAHELGHGLAAGAVGFDFSSFVIYPDGSGYAKWHGTPNNLQRAFVSAGGLIGPAAVAATCFAAGGSAGVVRRVFLGFGVGLIALDLFVVTDLFSRLFFGVLAGGFVLVGVRSRKDSARIVMFTFSIALLLAEIFVVSNPFGFAFVGGLSLTLLVIAVKGGRGLSQVVLVFLAVQLALSVFSRGDYLFTPTAHTSAGVGPSDVAQIAEALWLPYWFWGAWCGLLSVVILIAGVRAFLSR